MTTTTSNSDPRVQIPDKLFFRIGDVAELVGVKPYVLRYWETEFPIISPKKSPTGQRVYRRSDVETVIMIKHLLYDERYSIEGARKRIKELRREGDLKSFKEVAARDAVATAAQAASAASLQGENEQERRNRRERLNEMKGLARELLGLGRAPVSRLFGL